MSYLFSQAQSILRKAQIILSNWTKFGFFADHALTPRVRGSAHKGFVTNTAIRGKLIKYYRKFGYIALSTQFLTSNDDKITKKFTVQ